MKSAAALVALAVAGVSGAAIQRRDATFQLFVYGHSVDGLPVFSDGESLYAGDFGAFGNNSVPILVTVPSETDDEGNSLTVNPLMNSTWSNRVLSVPLAGTVDHTVALHESGDSGDYRADNFIMYGAYVFVLESTGTINDLWYTTPTTFDGVVKVNWNQTSDTTDGQVRVSLRTIGQPTTTTTTSASSSSPSSSS